MPSRFWTLEIQDILYTDITLWAQNPAGPMKSAFVEASEPMIFIPRVAFLEFKDFMQ